MLFGHIETGHALDVWDHPDIASYEKWATIAAGDAYSKWQIVQLQDGVCTGAKSDGSGGYANPDGSAVAKDGTYTPPTTPQTKPPPPATTKQQILDQIAVLTSLANQLP